MGVDQGEQTPTRPRDGGGNGCWFRMCASLPLQRRGRGWAGQGASAWRCELPAPAAATDLIRNVSTGPARAGETPSKCHPRGRADLPCRHSGAAQRNRESSDLLLDSGFRRNDGGGGSPALPVPLAQMPVPPSRTFLTPSFRGRVAEPGIQGPEVPQRSRPASCSVLRTGDSRYSSTVRLPRLISAVTCMPEDSAWRTPSRSRYGVFNATSAR
jgi:hypothetical protein